METGLYTENQTMMDCHRCLEYKRGDCAGNLKKDICGDYRHTPEMTDADRENWPTSCSGAYGSYGGQYDYWDY